MTEGRAFQVDVGELTFHGSRAVGSAVVRVGNQAFPSEGWHDFPVVVIGWLALAVDRLRRGSATRETVRFMDGPFMLLLERAAPGLVLVTGVEEPARVRMKVVVPEERLVSAVESAGRALLAKCQAARWWSNDAATLDRALSSMSGSV